MAEHLTLEFLTGLALGLCIGALLGGLVIGGIVAYLMEVDFQATEEE